LIDEPETGMDFEGKGRGLNEMLHVSLNLPGKPEEN
jgi:hypothetical protein